MRNYGGIKVKEGLNGHRLNGVKVLNNSIFLNMYIIDYVLEVYADIWLLHTFLVEIIVNSAQILALAGAELDKNQKDFGTHRNTDGQTKSHLRWRMAHHLKVWWSFCPSTSMVRFCITKKVVNLKKCEIFEGHRVNMIAMTDQVTSFTADSHNRNKQTQHIEIKRINSTKQKKKKKTCFMKLFYAIIMA